MITKNYQNKINQPNLLKKYAELECILFFDIETTGLSPASSFCYLITYGYFKDSVFYLCQLFAENMNDEYAVLDAFERVLPNFTLIAQFNGNRFDIPYVKSRSEYHGIISSFGSLEPFDIYLYTKEFKKLFQTPNCKLKTFEKLISIRRKDLIDGGEAIDEYYNYVSTGDTDSLDACLLHNYEDVLYLPPISELVIFNQLKEPDSKIKCYTNEDSLVLEINTDTNLNLNICFCSEDISFTFKNNLAQIKIKITDNTIKMRFKDYKKYVFLKSENYAVEAAYVKSFKLKDTKKCNLSNAYQICQVDSVISSESNIHTLWSESYGWILELIKTT